MQEQDKKSHDPVKGWRFIGPQQRCSTPLSFRRYSHFKGGDYIVLGVAKPFFDSPDWPAFALAEYSEDTSIHLMLSFWGCGDLLYHVAFPTSLPGDDLVIYWSLAKTRFFARPINMWDEWIPAAGCHRFELSKNWV